MPMTHEGRKKGASCVSGIRPKTAYPYAGCPRLGAIGQQVLADDGGSVCVCVCVLKHFHFLLIT